MVVTLNNSTATFYSYETLIPLNQIKLFNNYQSVIQQSKHIFLLSQQNIQKIDLENQTILIIYSFSIGDSVYYTDNSIIINLMSSIKIINFLSNESQAYQIQNSISFDFSPQVSSQSSQPSNQNKKDDKSFQSTIQLQFDSQGCFFINESSKKPAIVNRQIVNQTYFESLPDYQLSFEQNQNQYQPRFNNFFTDKMVVILSTISNQEIQIFDINAHQYIIISVYENNLQILDAFEYENKLRFVYMNCDYYQGVFQSDQPHFAQSASKNKSQTIQYNSFDVSDNIYYLNGIFKIIYSNDTNAMVIIFKTGFRVKYLDGQKPVFEKNLRLQVFDAEIISQLTDQPHFAQTTQQIIEYRFFNNYESLILATQIEASEQYIQMDSNLFSNFATNEQININIRPSSDYVTISQSSQYIGKRQFLPINNNNEHVKNQNIFVEQDIIKSLKSNNYKFLSFIAQKSQGIVVFAYSEYDQSNVAIKIFKDHEEFEQEKSNLSKLKGEKYIIQMLSEIQSMEMRALVLELQRCILQEILSMNKLSSKQVLILTQQMLKALASLQLYGVIHSDIKPENILYNFTRNEFIVSDLGLSHVLKNPFKQQTNKSLLGNDGFKSSEVLKEEKPYTIKVDTFSMGILILVALLNGTLNSLQIYQLKFQLLESVMPEITNHPNYDFIYEIISNMIHFDSEMRFFPVQLFQKFNSLYQINNKCLNQLVLPQKQGFDQAQIVQAQLNINLKKCNLPQDQKIQTSFDQIKPAFQQNNENKFQQQKFDQYQSFSNNPFELKNTYQNQESPTTLNQFENKLAVQPSYYDVNQKQLSFLEKQNLPQDQQIQIGFDQIKPDFQQNNENQYQQQKFGQYYSFSNNPFELKNTYQSQESSTTQNQFKNKLAVQPSYYNENQNQQQKFDQYQSFSNNPFELKNTYQNQESPTTLNQFENKLAEKLSYFVGNQNQLSFLEKQNLPQHQQIYTDFDQIKPSFQQNNENQYQQQKFEQYQSFSNNPFELKNTYQNQESPITLNQFENKLGVQLSYLNENQKQLSFLEKQNLPQDQQIKTGIKLTFQQDNQNQYQLQKFDQYQIFSNNPFGLKNAYQSYESTITLNLFENTAEVQSSYYNKNQKPLSFLEKQVLPLDLQINNVFDQIKPNFQYDNQNSTTQTQFENKLAVQPSYYNENQNQQQKFDQYQSFSNNHFELKNTYQNQESPTTFNQFENKLAVQLSYFNGNQNQLQFLEKQNLPQDQQIYTDFDQIIPYFQQNNENKYQQQKFDQYQSFSNNPFELKNTYQNQKSPTTLNQFENKLAVQLSYFNENQKQLSFLENSSIFSNDKIEDLFQKFLVRFNANSWNQAYELILICSQKQPKKPQFWYYLGYTQVELKLFDEAIKSYQTYIQLNPQYYQVFCNLGVAYGSKGMLGEAIRLFQRCLELNPQYYKAFDNLGLAYKKKGMLHEAIKMFNRCLELNPQYQNCQKNLEITKKQIYQGPNSS
ncbi:hypothetical protein ABPG72_009206 [Tetrahymena utriculariae]